MAIIEVCVTNNDYEVRVDSYRFETDGAARSYFDNVSDSLAKNLEAGIIKDFQVTRVK